VVAAVPVPVIGNGDLLFPHEIDAARARSGCAGVMVARGVLIKPWLFTEARDGRVWDIDAEARVGLYRRYVELAVAHWGDDEHGHSRVREFLRWHLAFWCRYRPPRRDGTLPTMQTRDTGFEPRTPLEALLARADEPALDYVCDRLMAGAPVVPSDAPAPGGESSEDERPVEG
jgi:tRNA-dihydrouridine synthase 3